VNDDALLEPFPVRLSEAQTELAERLKGQLSKKAAGAKISRSEVLRLAVELGLRQLEQDLKESA